MTSDLGVSSSQSHLISLFYEMWTFFSSIVDPQLMNLIFGWKFYSLKFPVYSCLFMYFLYAFICPSQASKTIIQICYSCRREKHMGSQKQHLPPRVSSILRRKSQSHGSCVSGTVTNRTLLPSASMNGLLGLWTSSKVSWTMSTWNIFENGPLKETTLSCTKTKKLKWVLLFQMSSE